MGLQVTDNESELLSRISRDDEKAFAMLFEAYHGQLGAFVYSLINSREMAEDIVQDIFVNIWTDRKSLPGIGKFTSYLFIITRNYTLNCIRKMANDQSRQERFLEAFKSETVNEGLFPADEPEYLSLLERAVAQLPAQQQRVFGMRRQGLRNPEIAAEMGITVESVKKYQQLALKAVSEFVRTHSAVGLMLSGCTFLSL